MAIDNGADALETDVSVSSDGVLYCFHDSTVDGKTDGAGNFVTLTSAYIDSLQYDAGIGTPQEPLRITRFSDYLAIASAAGKRIHPEIKRIRSTADIGLIVNAIVAAGMADKCCLSAFQIGRLRIARALNSRMELALISASFDPGVLEDAVDQSASLGNSGVTVDYNSALANPDSVAYGVSRGVKWSVYTLVDESPLAALKGLGIHRFVCDVPIDVT